MRPLLLRIEGVMFDPARLIQARRLRGLTPKELAAEAGTSPQTIGLYEAGVNTPGATMLVRLAKALDIPPAFFEAGRPMARLDSAEVYICGD